MKQSHVVSADIDLPQDSGELHDGQCSGSANDMDIAADIATDIANDSASISVNTSTHEIDLSVEQEACAPESLVVLSGNQTGATMDIAEREKLAVGTGYDCDIVLRVASGEAISLEIERYQSVRRLRVFEGSVLLAGEVLQLNEYYKLGVNTEVAFGEVSFELTGGAVTESVDAEPGDSTIVSTTGRTTAIAAVVAGIAMLGAIVVQEHFKELTEQPSVSVPFEQRLASLGLDNVQLIAESESENILVQGRVEDRETYRQLNLLASTDAKPVALDVQIDAELVEALRDIYRNHGISAQIEVLGRGHVHVETTGVEEQMLLNIEETLRTDLPMLSTLESSNTPPVSPPVQTNAADLDPAKEVEAVIAGETSYVITRDQARYFVGAMLPSGHVISSISEGVVVMMRDGEETRMNF